MKFTGIHTILHVVELLLLSAATLLAQSNNISFQRYSVEDGLSNSTVTAIAQDSSGFMWIGTEDGLNRFDGYMFTTYKHNPADSTSIVAAEIRAIVCDEAGTLWIATAGGLDKYDRSRDRFVHVPLPTTDTSGLSAMALSTLTIERENDLWIGTLGIGLYLLDTRTGVTQTYRHDPANPHTIANDTIRCVYLARDGKTWISFHATGLSVYDPRENTFSNFETQIPDAEQSTQAQITSICEDREGKIWFSTFGDGLFRFNDSLHQLIHYRHDPEDPDTYNDNVALVLKSDSHGNFWIGNFTTGLDRFDFPQNSFIHYQHNDNDLASLGNNRIYALLEDRTGSLWIGTWRGGLNVYQPFKRKFEHRRNIPGNPNSLSDNTVLAICEDTSGEVWIGTEQGGLNRFDPIAGTFDHYLHDPSKPNSISDNHVSAIREDHLGELWVATASDGLNRFDRTRGTFFRYMHEPGNEASLSSNSVTTLFEDKEGELWIGTYEGIVNRFDRSSNIFSHFDFEDSVKSARSEIQSITQSESGEIWIGTFLSGVFRFNKTSHTLRHYVHNDNDPHSISKSSVYSIGIDASGTIWIGTFGGGLERFDAATDGFEHFTEFDGLPSNFVKGIVSDQNGNLWLSTTKGLSKFDPRSRKFRNYDPEDGVQANEFRTGACWKGKSGTMYFGGISGFNMFKPDSVRDNPAIPPIIITSFKVLDNSVPLQSSGSEINEVHLSYWEDFFSFEFVALNYTSSRKNMYAYRLEGFDKDWIRCGTRRFASYTHLDGGEYVFKVKGSNNDGVWNEAGTSVRLIIHPPIWDRWWFRALAGVLIAGVPFFIYRYRFTRLLELERTRNRIARDLHDEVSATLSGINYFSEAISSGIKQHDERRVEKYLSLIRDSAGSVQDSVADIIWSVNPEYDGWDQLFAKLRRYASDLFESKSIRYAIEIPEKLTIRPLSMEMRRNFWLLYREMITNVVKHSACGTVAVRIALNDDRRLSLVIADDGKGFDASTPTRQHGLSNIRARAEALKGTLELDTSPDGGTTWKLLFPVG